MLHFQEKVWIRRLRADIPEVVGKVVGVASEELAPKVKFYIVETLYEKLPGQGDWTHIVLPSSCLDPMTENEWLIYRRSRGTIYIVDARRDGPK